jgi:hypothetical protein
MSLIDRDHELERLRITATSKRGCDVPPTHGDCPPGNEAPPRQAVLVRLSDVEPEAVTWLWEPYIARGKLTLLEGDPATGKTWLALAIAAALSRGWSLPDASGRPALRRIGAEHVVYLTAEDGLADTLRVRLDAVAADCSQIHALTAAREGDAEIAVTLRDIDILDDALSRTGAALVVVDPIQGFLGAGIDMHRANEVRPVLAGLAKLAERHGSAVLCIRHLSKANAERVLYRGLGSIDFTAAARSVLLAGRDPNDPNRRALVQIKNSLAPEGPALAYAIDAVRFEWAGLSNLTAGSLLAADSGDPERSARDEARDLLAAVLADGPVPAKAAQKQAREAGVTERTLYRAKAELGVKSFKTADGWAWTLPKASTLPRLPHSECGNVGNLGDDTREVVEV